MSRLNAVPYLALASTLLILLPLTSLASEPTPAKQASFEGTVLEVIPCTNISGSLVTIGSSGSQFIYREGISKSAPINASPAVGKEVSGVLLPSFIDCEVGAGAEAITFKRQSILYYASARTVYAEPSQASAPRSSNQSPSSSSSESSFGGFSGLFSKLQSSFSSLFSGSSGQTQSTSALTHTTSNSNASVSNASNANTSAGASSAGGISISQPYGGIVLAVVPCTCSAGDFMITLGPPSAGTYLFSPTSVPTIYPYGLVIVPGVHHLGFYRPFGFCKMIATPCVVIPMTRGTITSVGTSLPGM
ncbi:MAG: hypothetical protein WC880_01630 [Candidatus Paceibacterota bacterium]